MRSFTRQLVQYGFKKRWNQVAGMNEYWHAGFVRGRPDLLTTVLRRNEPLPSKPSNASTDHVASESSSRSTNNCASLDRLCAAPAPKKARTSKHDVSAATALLELGFDAAAAGAAVAATTTAVAAAVATATPPLTSQPASTSPVSFAAASHLVEESGDELDLTTQPNKEGEGSLGICEGEGHRRASHGSVLTSHGLEGHEELQSMQIANHTELVGALRTAQVALSVFPAHKHLLFLLPLPLCGRCVRGCTFVIKRF